MESLKIKSLRLICKYVYPNIALSLTVVSNGEFKGKIKSLIFFLNAFITLCFSWLHVKRRFRRQRHEAGHC